MDYTTITTMSEDDDDIHKGNIIVGQNLRNSVVTNIKVEVAEDDDRYRVKKHITLLNGVILISTYIRTKAEGLSNLDQVGEVSLSPAQLLELEKANQKDDTDARAKVKAAMEERKRKKAGKTKEPPPPPPPPPKKEEEPEPEPIMTIHVKTIDGSKTISIENVQPTDTIQDIKNKVNDLEGIPVDEQRLIFKGKELDNPSSTLADNGIENGSTLDLEPMQITVKTPDGKSIPITVKPSDTVHDVKDKVQTATGIPIDEQRLLFGGNELPDDATLKDSGIQHGSNLDLGAMTIKVQKPDGTIVSLDVKPSDSVKDVKNKIKNQEGIPIDEQQLSFDGKELKDDSPTMSDCNIKHGSTLKLLPMQIQVKTPTGKVIPIDVKPTDTIMDVKEKVLAKEGIPIDEQRLIFKGKELDNPSATLADSGIPNGSTLDLEPMQITVKTPDGKSIPVSVKPSDTVHDVKDKVLKATGIPIDEQRLLFGGKELPNDATLKDSGIKHGSNVDLGAMTIKVQKPDGTIVSLNVKPSDSVKDLKKKIEKQEGIPVKEQQLSFDGKELKDDSPTLTDCNIKHGSTLKLLPMQIHVKTPAGKVIPIDAKPTDTILDVKEKVLAKEGIPIDEQRLIFKGKELDNPSATLANSGIPNGSTLDLEPMQITVKTPDGKSIPVSVKPSDTVHDVKGKVLKATGIPIDEQRLLFGGKELPDDATLKDSGIQHGSNLDLGAMTIKIQKPDGTIVSLDVKPSDSVKDLKKKIEKQEGIPIDEQQLSFAGKELKDDSPTLTDCNIKHGSTLKLLPMQIHVKTPAGKVIPVDVKPTDTIFDVKEKVNAKEGIPVDEQCLIFKGKELDNPSATLADSGIPNGSTLDLKSMQIQVKTPSGELIAVDVEPTDTVKDVKKKVKAKGGIPVEEQRLLFNGEELDDGPTLRDYNIKDGSILDMMDDKIQIKVQTPDGKIIPLDVKPTDTVESVKKRVEDSEGIPIAEQTLLFNGKDLKNNQTLAEYDIKDGSTLNLSGGMQIDIKDWNGLKFTLDVTPDEKISEIKQKIKEKEGHPIGRQYLIFGGKLLEDDQTLLQYSIKNKSLVNLERMKIYIKTPTGKFTLNVDRDNTIPEIKEMIHQKDKTYPPEEQLLSFDSVQLDDDDDDDDDDDKKKTLTDYGIQYKSTLVLEAAKVPEYDVKVGPWQSGFDFVGKPKAKREGKRKKKAPGVLY